MKNTEQIFLLISKYIVLVVQLKPKQSKFIFYIDNVIYSIHLTPQVRSQQVNLNKNLITVGFFKVNPSSNKYDQ